MLGVSPKELQNLVQFKIIRPIRRERLHWFDERLLLEAKIALYLKECLGTPTEILALCGKAFSGLNHQDLMRIPYLTLESRPVRGPKPLEIRIPLGDLARELVVGHFESMRATISSIVQT